MSDSTNLFSDLTKSQAGADQQKTTDTSKSSSEKNIFQDLTKPQESSAASVPAPADSVSSASTPQSDNLFQDLTKPTADTSQQQPSQDNGNIFADLTKQPQDASTSPQVQQALAQDQPQGLPDINPQAQAPDVPTAAKYQPDSKMHTGMAAEVKPQLKRSDNPSSDLTPPDAADATAVPQGVQQGLDAWTGNANVTQTPTPQQALGGDVQINGQNQPDVSIGDSMAQLATGIKNVGKVIGGDFTQTAAGIARRFNYELGQKDNLATQLGAMLMPPGIPDTHGNLVSPAIKPAFQFMDNVLRKMNGATPDEWAQAKEGGIQDLSNYGQELQNAIDQNKLSFGQQSALGAARSFAEALPLLLTKNPELAAVGFGVLQYGQSYDTARKKGISPQKSQQYALIDAMIEGGTEYLPMKKLFGEKLLTTRFREFMAQEIPQELAASFGEQLNAQYHDVSPPMSFGEWAQLAALTVTSTAMGGGMQVGAAHAHQKIMELAQARRDKKMLPKVAEKYGIDPQQLASLDFSPVSPEQQNFMKAAMHAMANSQYALTTQHLNKLNDVGSVSRQAVEDLMKSKTMTDSERQIWQHALDSSQGEKIHLPEFKQKVQDKLFPLQFKDVTDAHSRKTFQGDPILHYGYDAIGLEPSLNEESGIPRDQRWAHSYELPFATGRKAMTHINSPNEFGFTRGFQKDNVPHVLEIQSDVNAPSRQKLDTEAEQTNVRQFLESRIKQNKDMLKALDTFQQTGDSSQLSHFLSEGELQRVKDFPMLAETMHANLKDTFVTDTKAVRKMAKKERQISRTKYISKLYKNWQHVILQNEFRHAAQKGQMTVRIASPDTVAQAEGWLNLDQGWARRTVAPKNKGLYKEYQRTHKWLKENFDTHDYTDAVGNTWTEVNLPPYYAYAPIDVMTAGISGKKVTDWVVKAIRSLKAVSGPELNPEHTKQLRAELDTYNRTLGYVMSLTQVGEENKHIPELQKYISATRDSWNTKVIWTDRADKVLKEWKSLSADQQRRLSKFLLATSVKSHQEGRRLTGDELRQIDQFREHKLSDGAWEVFHSVNRYFQDVLTELESHMVEERRRAFMPDNPSAFREAETQVHAMFNKLRNQNFFPFSRFGEYAVTVRANKGTQLNGRKYKAGDIVWMETFDGMFANHKMRKRASELLRSYPEDSYSHSTGLLTDSIWGQNRDQMPAQIKELMKEKLGLSAQQKTLLESLLVQLSPAQSFAKHMLERKATPGFSEDAPRAFADYGVKWANRISRLKASQDMIQAVSDLRRTASEIRQRQGVNDTTKRDGIVQYLEGHYNYYMNPGNELAGLRSLAFLFHLGYLPKSAYINLTQPLLVTMPHLAATHGGIGKGDARAMAAMLGAYKDVSRSMVNPKVYETELAETLDRLHKAGLLDESLATELAATAQGKLVDRMLPTSQAGRMIRTASYFGAYLFQHAEMLNRRVAAIAAFRLSMKDVAKGRQWHELSNAEREHIYEQTRRAVELTQYEYARWNRAPILQGKRSAVLMFYNYIQSTLYFLSRVPGRGRFLLMLLAAGGYEALPFFSNIADIIDSVLTSYPDLRKRLGLSNKPMTDIRYEMREFIAQHTNPDIADLVAHGIGREYGLGPLHLVSLAGVDFPHFDISGSLSLGQIIPGTDAIRMAAYHRDPNEIMTQTLKDVGGAALGIPINMYQMAISTGDPSAMHRVGKAMPTEMNWLYKATQAVANKGYENNVGAKMIPLDFSDTHDVLEAIGLAAGFNPTRLAQQNEMRWTQREHAMFYEAQRRIIIAEYIKAITDGDPQAQAAVEKSINEYNNTSPKSAPKLRARSIRSAIHNRFKQRAYQEAGTTTTKGNRALYEQIQSSFPDANLQSSQNSQ